MTGGARMSVRAHAPDSAAGRLQRHRRGRQLSVPAGAAADRARTTASRPAPRSSPSPPTWCRSPSACCCPVRSPIATAAARCSSAAWPVRAARRCCATSRPPWAGSSRRACCRARPAASASPCRAPASAICSRSTSWRACTPSSPWRWCWVRRSRRMAGGLITRFVGWQSGFLWLAGAAGLIALACFIWLPETRAADANAHSFGVLWRESRALLARPLFMGYVLQAALIYALFFVFVSLAPYVMVQILGHARRPVRALLPVPRRRFLHRQPAGVALRRTSRRGAPDERRTRLAAGRRLRRAGAGAARPARIRWRCSCR